MLMYVFFFFKQKTAYEMRISDWSSDVCSSDLRQLLRRSARSGQANPGERLQGTGDQRRGGGRGSQAASGVHPESARQGAAQRRGRQTSGEIGRASCRERVCQYV